jgi:hypothetical protein
MIQGKFMLIGRSGKLLGRREGALHTLEFILPENREYSIGIDQSTSCTGFYLTDRDTSFHLIGDITPYDSTRDTLYKSMEIFIKRMVKGKQIDLFVIEAPLPYGSGKRNKVLMELFREIRGWKEIIPELSLLAENKFTTIPPNVWKKHIVDSSKGTNRTRSKVLMAEDLLDKFPELRHFFDITDSRSDYDAFDAAGVLHGYKMEHGVKFSDTGAHLTKVGGTKDYTGHIVAFYLPLDSGKPIQAQMEDFNELAQMYLPEFLESDPEISWFENVRKSATMGKMNMILVKEPKHRIMLQWMANFPNKDAVILSLVFRKSAVTGKLLEYLKSKHFYEEIR